MSEENNDKRSFAERSSDITELLNGEPASVDDIASKFHLYGLEKRAQFLDGIKAEGQNRTYGGSPEGLRRAARDQSLHRKLLATHHRLRELGR